MSIHEFGQDYEEAVLLIHPSIVKWDYFEYVIPLLEGSYHLLVPALPGYDFEDESNFTSVGQIADELGAWIRRLTSRDCMPCTGAPWGAPSRFWWRSGRPFPYATASWTEASRPTSCPGSPRAS